MHIELPEPATVAAVAVTAYLCGSVPFGYIVARLKGVDIRAVGSGNIGATNVKRACGAALGRLVLILDISKGFLPTLLLAPWVVSVLEPAPMAEGLTGQGGPSAMMARALAIRASAMSLAGLAAIAGHNWPVWLRLKGGKGVAVTIGAFAALLQWWVFVPLVIWAAVAKFSGYVSVASMAFGCAIAATAGGLLASGRADASSLAAALAAAALIFARHRSNISRLIAGTEPRRGEGLRETAASPAEGTEDMGNPPGGGGNGQ